MQTSFEQAEVIFTFTAGVPYGQFKTLPSLRSPQMSYIAQYSGECLSLTRKLEVGES